MASVELLWKEPPSDTALANDEVQVWSVDLDQPSSRVGELFHFLSPDEQQRASRFQIEQKRLENVVGRATLRRLLGKFLALDPAALVFNYTSRGKPELAGALAGKLHFSVSHSGGLALIAVTRLCPIGVDVEHVRPRRYDIEVARRFFTTRESTVLESLPEADRPAAFFNLWTRKEAWLKATGVGIAESMNRVELSFLPGEPAHILSVADAPDEAGKWTLAGLNPATGFIGALAVRARDLNVLCRHWVE